MQLTTPDANGFGSLLSELIRKLKDIIKGRESAEEECVNSGFKADQALENFRSKLRERIRAEHRSRKAEFIRKEEDIHAEHEERSSRMDVI